MIRFACASCKKSISAPDEKAGMRFLCPGCKSPIEVPAAHTAVQEVAAVQRPRASAQGIATQPAMTPVAVDETAPKPVPMRFLGECLAIVGATFRQTLKPFTLAFEIHRRGRLRKKTAQAQFTLGQRMVEAQLGDAKLRSRIKVLGERIQSIQDVKGDARQPTAERKETISKLAEPLMTAPNAPEAVASEHERAQTLAAKLRTQEESLQGAFGGLMPANGVMWRRVILGYSTSFVFAALVVLIVYKAGEGGRVARERQKQEMAAQQADEEKKQQEDAKWATKKDTEAIVDLCAPSVAKISLKIGKKEGGGTGFMIRPGVIMTNAHVVESALAEDLKVYFPSAKEIGKTPFSCRIVYFDRKRDLAMLAVEPKVPPLRLAENFEFKSGRHITIIGCPGFGDKLLENAPTSGTLGTETKVTGEFGELPFYQLSASVNPGNSGGPVFDNRGQVIGLVTLKATKQEGLSFCIPWKDVKERLEGLEKEDPNKAAAVATSTHRLHVMLERVGVCGMLYRAIAARYLLSMQFAISSRRPIQQAINGTRTQSDELLRELNKIMDSKYQKVGVSLADDPNLPDTLRGQYSELWKTYLELKQLAENPDPNFNNYANRMKGATGRFGTQIGGLAKSLGFEPPKVDED